MRTIGRQDLILHPAQHAAEAALVLGDLGFLPAPHDPADPSARFVRGIVRARYLRPSWSPARLRIAGALLPTRGLAPDVAAQLIFPEPMTRQRAAARTVKAVRRYVAAAGLPPEPHSETAALLVAVLSPRRGAPQ